MHKPPDQAHWFGLERAEGDDWLRLDDDSIGGSWWRVGAVSPEAVAERAGPGTYRTVWAPKDRRKMLGKSLPFDHELSHESPPNSAAAPAEQPQPEQPSPAQAAADPPAAKPEAGAKKANGRARARVTDMPTMDPVALTAETLHPLGQTVYLHSLAQAQSDKLHHLLLQSMHMMVESERARSREHTESVAAHYRALDNNRTDLMKVVLTLTQQQSAAAAAAAASAPSPELTAVTAQIAKLAEQVEELGDMDEEVERAMSQFSENPNDLERALVALQGIVGMLANSPLGQALAAKLEQPSQPVAAE